MQKLKPAYNHFPELGRSTAGAQKAIGCRLKKTKTKPVRASKK